jgi:hypothetical protein
VLNIRCALDLAVTDDANRTTTGRTTVTIVPPPLPEVAVFVVLSLPNRIITCGCPLSSVKCMTSVIFLTVPDFA